MEDRGGRGKGGEGRLRSFVVRLCVESLPYRRGKLSSYQALKP